MRYMWSKHLFEVSARFQNEVTNITVFEPNSSSNLAALLSPGQNCEFVHRKSLQFSKSQTIIRARKYEILKVTFNQLLALKTRNMTSFVVIITRGANMMNGKGATETPDEWAPFQFKK
jgi:hypothetical protein